MKTCLFLRCLLVAALSTLISFTNHSLANPDLAERISFMLKNTSGHHRMFRVEGPGIAYGFTMNRREMIPCHWPVGSKLFFSHNGETNEGLILTVTAADEGKTLMTGNPVLAPKPESSALLANEVIVVRFRNNSLLPHKVAIITYKPGEMSNSTQIVTLWPFASARQKLPVGTKVYFADDNQVNTVMSGQPLTGKLSLVIGQDDNQETFNIW